MLKGDIMELPVYLFTGFLEAGKTRFIQETLEDRRFNNGERTLLLLCEEGEEEYEPSTFVSPNIVIKTVEEESDLTTEFLTKAAKECRAQRVLVEYNGMWTIDTLYQNMPRGWIIYQEFCFADARTFLTYNANMRQLVVDKLQSCELIVFNRFSKEMDKMAFHKIVRGSSRRCDIAYEYPDGQVEYDDIEDPLPFDLNAPVVTIADEDYAIWYRDMTEDLQKYNGRVVRFKGMVNRDRRFPEGCFVVGRKIMTCCEADITYSGMVAEWGGAASLKTKDWVTVTARLSVQKHKLYRKEGPVLQVQTVEPWVHGVFFWFGFP